MRVIFKCRRAARSYRVILALFVAAAVCIFFEYKGQDALAAADADNLLQEAVEHYVNLRDGEALEILSVLAEQGMDDANVLLGYLYSDPLFDRRDYQMALGFFERAAENDHSEALFQIAESRFWPTYLTWDLSPEDFRNVPDKRSVLQNLRSAVGTGHHGAQLRLASLCMYFEFPCTSSEIESSTTVGIELFGDKLRTLTTIFRALGYMAESKASGGEPDTRALTEFQNGISLLDPFVSSVFTDKRWRNVHEVSQCPQVHDINAVLRLHAIKNGVHIEYSDGIPFEQCYADEEKRIIELKLLAFTDAAVTLYGTRTAAHLSYCYEEVEYEELGPCLTTSMIDYYFSCLRLSLHNYLRQFNVAYEHSQRYRQCRSHYLKNR